MEINTQQIEALLKTQEQKAQRKTGETGQGFEAVLSQQMAAEAQGEVTPPSAAPQAEMISQILLDKSGLDYAALNSAFDQASGALDLWDSYARSIRQDQTSLRDAYSILEGIDSKVSQLRQESASMNIRHSGLDEVLSQLEILSATEKFKLNRGDYSA